MAKKIDIDKILHSICEGMSIRECSLQYNLAKSTICDHLLRAENREKYDTALQIRTMCRVDQMLEHLDKLLEGRPSDTDISVYRELKDSIKWIAGKEMSHRYGDKKELDVKVQNITDLLNELPDE